ncbi:MAG: glycosyltransferase family 39 protein [Anaerolineae bacterium]
MAKPFLFNFNEKQALLWLALICVGAFVFRLALLPMAQHPGIGDPNHYYNLGQRLLDGHGFTIDYIWAFNRPYEQIEHPEDFWMPATGAVAAASMGLFGRDHAGALALFVVAGALVPLIGYAAGRQLQLSPVEALMAALLCALVPELVLNSLRTDTTILFTLCAGGALLVTSVALERQRWQWYAAAGALAGLAYLVRADAPIIILAAGLLVGWRWLRGGIQPRWRVVVALALPVAALIVVAPWFLRNIAELGTWSSADLGQLLLRIEFNDLYRFDNPVTLREFFERQTMSQIISRRLFELTAAARMMLLMLTDGLALGVIGGGLLLALHRERERLGRLAPVILTLGLLLLFYPVLIPTANQGGSFKKAYLSLVPLIVPVAIYGLRRAVPDGRLRAGIVFIAAGLMAMSAFELVRDQNRFVNGFIAAMERVAATLDTLPDTNGDGRLIVMTQDPFVLRYMGYQGVQFPLEDRDTIVYVAQRYGVDYLLMPSARPALEALESGREQDERFVFVTNVPGTRNSIWRLAPRS